ncbi:hypothetical protein E2562_033310 [Oryza meyeriana var. granulata]|uniref:Uncharacterized protein n=1 Tax=Oryza meyeriana var. granulata TaxID=110450 RepID=A0A6G1F0Z1_9ORYZ|nr:hypothetical protein E2562_033310 [Oryza meyeriana var. granulata]
MRSIGDRMLFIGLYQGFSLRAGISLGLRGIVYTSSGWAEPAGVDHYRQWNAPGLSFAQQILKTT